jgi:hypothetical protein
VQREVQAAHAIKATAVPTASMAICRIWASGSATRVLPTLNATGRGRRKISKTTTEKRGAKRDCLPCGHRERCFKDSGKTQTRQVAIFLGGSKQAPPSYLDLMKQKIGTREGRYEYSRRMGIVEPVFANICSTLGLNRFSLRTKRKVDIQRKLYCMGHNLLKIHRYGVLGI